MEVVFGAMAKIFEVFDVEIIEGERHAEIFAADSHFVSPNLSCVIPAKAGTQGSRVQAVALDPRLRGGDETGSCQPRRMTIDDAVDGFAQPRLALTSTFLTWRQPPSR